MMGSGRLHWRKTSLLAAALGAVALGGVARLPAQTEQAPAPREASAGADNAGSRKKTQPPAETAPPPSILAPECMPLSLADVLYLGNVQNPELMLARQRVNEALAQRMFAAAQLLPTVNAGGSFDQHSGPLQQSNGHILKVDRDAFYVGLGAYTVAAGTVNIPGLTYVFNPALSYFGFRGVQARIRERKFDTLAARNQVLLRVALAYTDLLRAEGRRAIAIQTRDDVREVARITRVQARANQARISDADRGATELSRRNALVVEAENEMLQASARLAQEINLDPSVRIRALDGWVLPVGIVPEDFPFRELVCMAILRRPELAAQQAAIQQALYALQASRSLALSPQVITAFSTGTYGGGGNFHNDPGYFQPAGFIQPQARFDTFAPRVDIDVIAFWALQNAGLGYVARNREALANLREEKYRQLIILNRVRDEVAEAFAHSHARLASVLTSERAIRAGQIAFDMDRQRTFNALGLPIEVLDSLRLLALSRYSYLDNIIAYNQAHFALYVALGCPPAALLIRPGSVGGSGQAEDRRPKDAAPTAAAGPQQAAGGGLPQGAAQQGSHDFVTRMQSGEEKP